jgi:hypothetical protein
MVIVQNIKFTTDNVEYKLERFYSPGEGKLYEAELPDGVNGDFDAELKGKHSSFTSITLAGLRRTK